MMSRTSQLTELRTSVEECVQIKEHADDKVSISSQNHIYSPSSSQIHVYV